MFTKRHPVFLLRLRFFAKTSFEVDILSSAKEVGDFATHPVLPLTEEQLELKKIAVQLTATMLDNHSGDWGRYSDGESV